MWQIAAIIGAGIVVVLLMFAWDQFNIKHDRFNKAHDWMVSHDDTFPRPNTFGNIGKLGDNVQEVNERIARIME
jgi:hypothetical protein